MLRNFENDSIEKAKKDNEETELNEQEGDNLSEKKERLRKKKILNKLMKRMQRKATSFQKRTSKNSETDLILGKSLFLFHQDNPIRLYLSKLVKNKKFEYLIVTLIIISTINLSIENPLDDPECLKTMILYYCDIVLSSSFIAEATIKIIAQGFLFNGPSSYLKDYWNLLDFFIVCCSILDFAAGSFKVFKVFRIIRTLRPLKVVTKNEGFKIVLKSLLLSLSDIGNGLLISLNFFFIFSIMFVNLFKGKLNECI